MTSSKDQTWSDTPASIAGVIIERFGEGAYISPIDEVLDEAGVMPGQG